MILLALVFALVGIGALVVAGRAVTQLAQGQQATLVLLADHLAASQADQRANLAAMVNDQRATRALLSSTHAASETHILEGFSQLYSSVSTTLSEAVERTTTAVGQAVQTAIAPPPAAPLSPREAAQRVAHDMAEAGYTVDDLDVSDPSDHDPWIAPERHMADLVDPHDANPTGVPGLRFDGAGVVLPFDPNIPMPNGAG